MTTIEYCKQGEAVSDFDIENWIKCVLTYDKSLNATFYVSTSLPVHAIQLAVSEGKIDPGSIQFRFQEKLIPINKYGAISGWPRGFADITGDYCEQTLRNAVNLRKKERDEKEKKCFKIIDFRASQIQFK